MRVAASLGCVLALLVLAACGGASPERHGGFTRDEAEEIARDLNGPGCPDSPMRKLRTRCQPRRAAWRCTTTGPDGYESVEDIAEGQPLIGNLC